MTAGTPGIEVQGLARSFGAKLALDDVSFKVERGQICGYLGPNGAGKSTTLLMLAGLLCPTRGSIWIAGHDLAMDSIGARRRLGFAPESGGLFPLLSPLEHLALCSDLHELDREDAARRGRDLLERLGAEDCASQRIDTLSKGQTQKVLLACTLLHDPEVLLLDEPLSGLDAAAVRSVKELLTELAAAGRAILFSSHVLDVVERVCERAIILDEGKLIADASTSDLLTAGDSSTLEDVFCRLTRSEGGP